MESRMFLNWLFNLADDLVTSVIFEHPIHDNGKS
jgi:hypothetical protein